MFLPFASLNYTPVMIYMGKYSEYRCFIIWACKFFGYCFSGDFPNCFGMFLLNIFQFREVNYETGKKNVAYAPNFVTQELKRMMEYKGDFIVGIIGFLLGQFFNLLFLMDYFQSDSKPNGWTLEQILFIYGFSLIPKGLDHLLFDNLWSIGHFTVRKGDFDKYLTRPNQHAFSRYG